MADFDYTKLTDQDFDRLLVSILDKMSGAQIVAVPGIYSAASNSRIDAKNSDISTGCGLQRKMAPSPTMSKSFTASTPVR